MTPLESLELAAQLLVPVRPSAREATQAMRGRPDLAEAWVSLSVHGLVPSRREVLGFWAPEVCAPCGGHGEIGHTVRIPSDHEHHVVSGCAACKRRGLAMPHAVLDEPPTRAIALAIASDPRGIEAAFEMAREACTHLAPWDRVAPPERIAWARLDELPAGRVGAWQHMPPAVALRRFAPRGTRAMQSAREAVKREVTSRVYRQWIDELARLIHPLDPRGRTDPYSLARVRAAADLEGYFWWLRAARTDALAPSSAPSEVANQPFSELADPFAPLMALWRLGYALERSVDGIMVVVASDVPSL